MWPMSVTSSGKLGTFDPPSVFIMKVERVFTPSVVNIIHDIFWEFHISLSINDFPHSLQICLCLLLSRYRNAIESHMRKSDKHTIQNWGWRKNPPFFKSLPKPPQGWSCEWFALGEAQSWVNDKPWTAPLGKQMVGEWKKGYVTNVILSECRRLQDLFTAWVLG